MRHRVIGAPVPQGAAPSRAPRAPVSLRLLRHAHTRQSLFGSTVQRGLPRAEDLRKAGGLPRNRWPSSITKRLQALDSMMTTQVRKIVMNTRPPETYRILRMSRMRSPALWVSAEADLTSSASARTPSTSPLMRSCSLPRSQRRGRWRWSWRRAWRHSGSGRRIERCRRIRPRRSSGRQAQCGALLVSFRSIP